jgi:hypothetical protein
LSPLTACAADHPRFSEHLGYFICGDSDDIRRDVVQVPLHELKGRSWRLVDVLSNEPLTEAETRCRASGYKSTLSRGNIFSFVWIRCNVRRRLWIH